MGPLSKTAVAAGAGVAAVFVLAHLGGGRLGRRVPGGMLVADAGGYDLATRLLAGPLYRSVADDVARTARPDARILEVGCGPGRLAIRLATEHGLDVTGLDLDPAMIERARANATDANGARRPPSFVVGDVAALPFPDASFDLVVSTLSMHHWADATAGLTEVARVLRSDGRALVWDLRPGIVPFHRGLPDPVERVHGAPLRVTSAAPWRWPGPLRFAERIELVPTVAD